MSPAELHSELFAQLGERFTGEAVFDCLPDLVFFIKNERGEYVVVNQTLVERCGKRKKSELIGRRPDELFPIPLGRSYRAQDEEVLRSGVAIRNQLELHLYPTGRHGWCLTNKLPLRRRGGGIAGLFGFSRDLQAATERSRDFSQVAEAVQRIQRQYAERLKVSELARRAGLSVYQFDQRMRRIFGITAGQLIQKTRMEAALERLRETDASVAAVASESGYSDQSAFTRRFHQTIGMSPSEYRSTMHQE
ncbi:MAG: helix-turn-helix domain-containing protein [Pseudomonadota bacterium]|nr:helix-turn-helix domain-containing protein [Pseudomonadota bacterium]